MIEIEVITLPHPRPTWWKHDAIARVPGDAGQTALAKVEQAIAAYQVQHPGSVVQVINVPELVPSGLSGDILTALEQQRPAPDYLQNMIEENQLWWQYLVEKLNIKWFSEDWGDALSSMTLFLMYGVRMSLDDEPAHTLH